MVALNNDSQGRGPIVSCDRIKPCTGGWVQASNISPITRARAKLQARLLLIFTNPHFFLQQQAALCANHKPFARRAEDLCRRLAKKRPHVKAGWLQRAPPSRRHGS